MLCKIPQLHSLQLYMYMTISFKFKCRVINLALNDYADYEDLLHTLL